MSKRYSPTERDRSLIKPCPWCAHDAPHRNPSEMVDDEDGVPVRVTTDPDTWVCAVGGCPCVIGANGIQVMAAGGAP